MPGFLLDSSATVLCAHGGQAQPTVTSQHVTIGGQPIVTQSAPYSIAGCALPPPPSGNGPCVTAQWTTAATKVTASGEPVLLQSSMAVCTPTGTPLNIVVTQTHVTGS